MLGNTDQELVDNVFEALANHKRRAAINTLAFRPATVSQLAKEHGISLPAIHRHIRALEKALLIQRRKVGRTNSVALKRKHFVIAQAWMAQYHMEWGNDSESLDNYISSLSKEINK